jgi:hypothetical protein
VSGFEAFERLPNVRVDGREVLRIRFDPTDPDLSPRRERVLVIDAETGVALRTETLDRHSWTELAAARRVDRIGERSSACDPIGADACAAIALDGPLEAEASQAAGRWAASIAGRRTLGSLDATDSAWSTSIAIADASDREGTIRPAGQCARDANWLSICRG